MDLLLKSVHAGNALQSCSRWADSHRLQAWCGRHAGCTSVPLCAVQVKSQGDDEAMFIDALCAVQVKS